MGNFRCSNCKRFVPTKGRTHDDTLERISTLQAGGETPLFECPRCGERRNS